MKIKKRILALTFVVMFSIAAPLVANARQVYICGHACSIFDYEDFKEFEKDVLPSIIKTRFSYYTCRQ